jgi:hypothetical protein
VPRRLCVALVEKLLRANYKFLREKPQVVCESNVMTHVTGCASELCEVIQMGISAVDVSCMMAGVRLPAGIL